MPLLIFIFSYKANFVGTAAALLLFFAQSQPDRHYQVKAAFLFNFTQFVEWPVTTFQHAEEPLVIAVIGQDPFGTYLDEVVAGESMQGHPMVVRRLNPEDEIEDCHILYINLPDREKTEEVLEKVKGRSILTVSDMPDFLKSGGMIRFVTVNNKIQFQINPAASIAADLTISSKLLNLAEIFSPE